MIKTLRLTSIIIFILFLSNDLLNAQHGITSSGGNVSGINGFTSYSIGQVTYSTISGSNGFIILGIQQPDFSVKCPGDINGDGIIGPSDLAVVLNEYGNDCTGCDADIDSSGSVGPGDLAIVLNKYGGPCE